MMSELVLLLADGRWPGGGYAHSGSLEAAVRAGLVHDAETLRLFVVGRLNTAGPFEAWLAGRSCDGESVDECNLRFEARTLPLRNGWPVRPLVVDSFGPVHESGQRYVRLRLRTSRLRSVLSPESLALVQSTPPASPFTTWLWGP